MEQKYLQLKLIALAKLSKHRLCVFISDSFY